MIRSLAAAIALAIASAAAASAPAVAQTATTLEIPLHSAYLGIRTTAPGRPDVRILSAAGTERLRVQPQGARPADGHWIVSLATGPSPIDSPLVLLRPGDQVVVRIDGVETRAPVPDMAITADAAADRVSGRLPPGIAAGLVLIQHDPDLFGQRANPPGVAVLAGAGGTFAASVADRIDLRPGIVGQLVCVDAAGNVFAAPFAVPIALIDGASYAALVRADAGSTAAIALQDADGAELARSGIAIELGGGLSIVALAQGGDLLAGLFAPRPGQRVALLVDDAVVAVEEVPLVSAVVDREAHEARGRAPAGSRVALEMRADASEEAAAVTAVVTATAEGAFAAPAGALDLRHDAAVRASAWAGGAFRWQVAGAVPHVQVVLWGDRVTGVAEARGEVRVRHRAADGTAGTLGIGATGPDGAFDVRLPSRGEPVAIAPGDAVEVAVGDESLAPLAVPELAAAPDEARRALAGRAPPGSEVRALAFPVGAGNAGIPPRVEVESDLLVGRAGADGAFALRCRRPECGTRHGALTADIGSARYVLHWLDAPIVGLAVTDGAVIGNATAGTMVTAASVGIDGAAGPVVAGRARPSDDGRWPAFSLDLRDLFPDGLAEGSRVRVAIDGAPRELRVPHFTWAADVLADTLRGEGPPLRALFVAVLGIPDGTRGGYGSTVIIGADGRWSQSLRPFDLRAGDELRLLLFADDHYLEWRDAIAGPPEPPPATAPAPSPTPALPPGDGRIHLPIGWR